MQPFIAYPNNQREYASTIGLLRYLVQKTQNNLTKEVSYKSRVLCSILDKIYTLTSVDLMDKHEDMRYVESILAKGVQRSYKPLPVDRYLGNVPNFINLSELNRITLREDIFYLQDGKQITVEKLPVSYVKVVNNLLVEYNYIRKLQILTAQQGYTQYGYTETLDYSSWL